MTTRCDLMRLYTHTYAYTDRYLRDNNKLRIKVTNKSDLTQKCIHLYNVFVGDFDCIKTCYMYTISVCEQNTDF